MGLEKINIIRKEKGITIEELSELSGVPLSTLKKISAGITTNPNLETVKAIARALGCKLDDFDDKKKEAPAHAQELPEDQTQLLTYYKNSTPEGRELLLSIATYTAHAASTGYFDPRIPAKERVLQSLARQAGLSQDSQEADGKQHA